MKNSDTPEMPAIEGQPTIVASAKMAYQEGDYRVYATELEIAWRWDLFKGSNHLHTGFAYSLETSVDTARRKIVFFKRPNVTRILSLSDES